MPGMSMGMMANPGMTGGPQDQSGMQRVMQARAQMQRQMSAGDDDLDRLVDEMNGSVGEHKVDAMAAIINRLMQERKSMRRGLASMGPMMGSPEMARSDGNARNASAEQGRAVRALAQQAHALQARAQQASAEEDNEDDDSDENMNAQPDPSSMWRQMLQRRIEERRAGAADGQPGPTDEPGPRARPQRSAPQIELNVRRGRPGPSTQSEEDEDDEE
jgi:hypothetical protein